MRKIELVLAYQPIQIVTGSLVVILQYYCSWLLVGVLTRAKDKKKRKNKHYCTITVVINIFPE